MVLYRIVLMAKRVKTCKSLKIVSSILQACSKCWLRQRKLPLQRYKGKKQLGRVGERLAVHND